MECKEEQIEKIKKFSLEHPVTSARRLSDNFYFSSSLSDLVRTLMRVRMIKQRLPVMQLDSSFVLSITTRIKTFDLLIGCHVSGRETTRKSAFTRGMDLAKCITLCFFL